MTTELWAIGLVLFAGIIGSFGPIFLKKASGKISFSLRSIIYNRYLITGLSFYGLATILFIPALIDIRGYGKDCL